MSNSSLRNKIENSLIGDNRLWVDDAKTILNETKLIDLIGKIDESIIENLLADDILRDKFFIKIKDAYVFNMNDFRFFIEENSVDNSYTRYANKIGLATNRHFIKDDDRVVLSFPFKDCVLEGGQTNEEGEDSYYEYDETVTKTQELKGLEAKKYNLKKSKRKEVFFNQILAKDEIDRLLDPKALINWKRYTADSVEPVSKISRDEEGVIKENLIIKGNNLLALHSLERQFPNKIKLIYIDPPYNTGSDSFKYNDKFSHSTWLTFMKNRLEESRKLLREDGSIWISLNDEEVHYAKIVCDEVFGRENFIANIIWHSKYTTSNDSKFISYQHENILFYVKNKSQFKINGFDRTEKQDKAYTNPDNDPKGPWKSTPLHAKSGKKENIYTMEFPNGISWTSPKGRFPSNSKKTLMDLYKEGRLHFNKNGGVDKKTYLTEVKQTVTPGSVWGYDEVGHTHGNNEELAELIGKGEFDNPKGIKLLKKICKVGNVQDGDIVMDYHAGSGTTAHAVLELNDEDQGSRRFIMIEQMDYVDTVTCSRVKKVLENDCLEASFLYCELAKWNEAAKDEINDCTSLDELINLFDKLYKNYFLNYNVNIKEFREDIVYEDTFKALTLEEQKRMFLTMLDLNQMYVNYSEMAAKRYVISKEDQALTKSFYNNDK